MGEGNFGYILEVFWTMKVRLVHIVGARPNFMKVAPIFREIEEHNRKNLHKSIEQFLVHTGQHYSLNMSEIFFRDLGIPEPHINLGVGSGNGAEYAPPILRL